jgi:hypothetical protein
MLTFVSGWKSEDREIALVGRRDQRRPAVFIIDDTSHLPELMPDAPVIDLYRNGKFEVEIGDEWNTFIRLNYDTDQELVGRAVTAVLMSGKDTQIIVTFDATDKLFRFFPALREANAMLCANERLDAPAGDHVLFTRGGSFSWRDNILESQTALLLDSEVYDAGIVPDEEER